MNTKKLLCLLVGFWCLASNGWAAPFTVATTQVDIVVAPPVNHAAVGVGITATQDFDYDALQVQSDAAWVTPVVDAAGKRVVLSFATGALVNATYTATITATHGADSRSFFVRAAVSPLNVIKLIDDPFRSRVYGIHQNGLQRGAIVVYDPINTQFINSVTTSRKPTDLAVSNDGSELFVINSVERAITVIDLATLAVKETIALTAYTDWGQNDTSANIKVGKGNILYYSDGEWAPALRVFDRVTHTVLQTIYVGGSNGYGCGDFALTPDKNMLIAWVQYGWTAGWAGSYIARFSVAANGTLAPAETTVSNYPTVLNRDPLDTPVFISNDGQLAFVKQLAVSASSVQETRQSFPSPVYSISDGGEIATTNQAIYETETGNKLYDLPVTTSVQAITSDYARLVYFNSAQRAFGTIDLSAAIGDAILNRQLYPANGSIVLSPAALQWHSVPGAQGYQVYLGTSEEAVRSATPGSPLFLGQTNSPMIALSSRLSPGVTYYWRIDTVTSAETSPSDVYHFTVSEISASMSEISTATVRGHSNLTIAIDLASENAGKPWQATSSVPWITFETANGVTPATLRVILNASQLTPGVHTADISIIGSSGGPFVIPVKMRVDALQLTILKSDRASELVYGISENTSATPAVAYLLEINTANQSISRVVPVGASVTDLAVHNADNRIYVPNWVGGSLLAIDRTSFQLVRTYNFQPAGPIGYSQGDVYRVTPGAAGRVIVEEYDQWIDVSLYDTVNGAEVGTAFARQGGGASDPTGRYYYHGDDNSSGAGLHRFDLTGDKFTEIGSGVRINPLSYYGTRLIVASEDGTRIFWNGMTFDQNLAPVVNLGDFVFSCTANGRYAFAEENIYDTQTGQIAFGMPADTTVSAFNSTSSKLVVQVGDAIRFFAFGASYSLPAPTLTAVANANHSVTLSWTDESLETGFTLQQRLADAQAWDDISASIARNTTSLTLTNLQLNKQYEFRIKADSPVASSGWSNIATATISGTPTPTPTPPTTGTFATLLTPGANASVSLPQTFSWELSDTTSVRVYFSTSPNASPGSIGTIWSLATFPGGGSFELSPDSFSQVVTLLGPNTVWYWTVGSSITSAHRQFAEWQQFTTAPCASAPLISPAGGTFKKRTTITITAVSGGTIHYTIDGSIPTRLSPIYNGPFSLTRAGTVRAKVVLSGYNDSPIASAEFKKKKKRR